MSKRKMLTFGLAAGLVALAGTCLVAKEKQADAADKAKPAAAEKAKEPATRTQVESSVTTNGNMVTERRRETTTTTDADGNVVATCTSESLQSYPVGETATAGVVAAPSAKAEPVNTDTFLGLKFGDVFKVGKKDIVRDVDEPSFVRAKFKPAKPLAGFDDYFVYLTPKTHKVAMVCACAPLPGRGAGEALPHVGAPPLVDASLLPLRRGPRTPRDRLPRRRVRRLRGRDLRLGRRSDARRGRGAGRDRRRGAQGRGEEPHEEDAGRPRRVLIREGAAAPCTC